MAIRFALIGLLAGVAGTGLGGVLSLYVLNRNPRQLSFLLAMSGGAMISISLLELVPEAIHIGGKSMAAAGLLVGTLIMFALDTLLPHTHQSLQNEPGRRRRRYHGERTARLRSMGILIGIGIAMHNFPEGLAIGAASAHEEKLGLGIALLISLHNIPEGMAMGVPLKAGDTASIRIVLLTALAGVPMGIGALIGSLIGGASNQALSISLGLAAGAMMYVVADELIPEAHQCTSEQYPTVGLVSGIFLGALAVFVL